MSTAMFSLAIIVTVFAVVQRTADGGGIPPILEPDNSAATQPGTTISYTHTVTNNGTRSTFDLTAVSNHSWTTRIYHDVDKNGTLDPGEPIVTDTGPMMRNDTFHIIVQIDVPASTGDVVDATTVTAASHKDWAVQDNATDTTTVIADKPPTAYFSWSPFVPNEGSVVQFTDLSTDPENNIVSRFWQFGDGGFSSLSNPSHAYGDVGPYQVTLTVTDADNLQDSITKSVSPSNVP
ncbi:MAG: PKD domain-containing protein, partial [Thermoplasmata archaeon]